MEQLIPILVRDEQQMVDARELHTFLEAGKHFTDWVKQMFGYGFEENVDYFFASPKSEAKNNGITDNRGGHNAVNYHLTLDTAKEIAMLQRSEKGKAARKYFIAVEKEAKKLVQKLGEQPPAIAMSQAELKDLMKQVAAEAVQKDREAQWKTESHRTLSDYAPQRKVSKPRITTPSDWQRVRAHAVQCGMRYRMLGASVLSEEFKDHNEAISYAAALLDGCLKVMLEDKFGYGGEHGEDSIDWCARGEQFLKTIANTDLIHNAWKPNARFFPNDVDHLRSMVDEVNWGNAMYNWDMNIIFAVMYFHKDVLHSDVLSCVYK